MRFALVLVVLLALNVYSADAWGIRRVFRSVRRAVSRVVSRVVKPIVRVVKPLAKEAAICYAKNYAMGKALSYGKAVLGKRDGDDVDRNMDGALDQAELESLLDTRDVEDFLRIADVNGDNKIDIEEFERAMNEGLYE